jgi:hypothetical protein
MAQLAKRREDSAPQAVRLVNKHGVEVIGAGGDTLVRFMQQALNFGEHQLFDQMPRALDQVIERGLWKERDKRFATFGEFALAPPPSGLGVHNDRTLALLKAAMDHKDKHIEEWSDVLVEVEKAIKIRQIEHVSPDDRFKARARKSIDGTLLTLRKARGSATTFKRIKAGKVTVTEVARERGVLPQGALTRYLKPGCEPPRKVSGVSSSNGLDRRSISIRICGVDSVVRKVLWIAGMAP